MVKNDTIWTAKVKQQNEVVRSKLGLLTALSLVSLSIAQILVQFREIEIAQTTSRIAFIALCLCMLPHFKFREWALLVCAILLSVGIFASGQEHGGILNALDRAAFFAAFIYLVTLLKEAAQRSPSVLALGQYLANQPSGRRFYSLSFGGHIAGVLLNFGAISLLAPLVQRGAQSQGNPDDPADPAPKILEQQQVSALTRGFTWMVMWSPTSLAQVVLFTTVPEADIRITLPLGIAATIAMIMIGRGEDRLRWRKTSLSTTNHTLHFPRRPAIRFAIVCILLIGLTILVANIAHVSIVIALMLVAPLLVMGWFFELNFTADIGEASQKALRQFTAMLGSSASVLGHSAITLGLAGFIGIAASKLAPIHIFSDFIATQTAPEWLVLTLLPAIILLCGQIALSPILVVVFLGSILGQLDAPLADPNLVFFALGAGWALSMLASPNASATLLLSGITRIPPTVLTWRWNGLYAALCFATFAISFWLLSSW